MKNVELLPYESGASFRKLAAAAWSAPREPNVYGSITVRAGPLLAWLHRQSEVQDEHLTVTHAVVRAVSVVLRRHPHANAFVRFGRLVRRRDVDVYVHVLVREGEGMAIGHADLAGVRLKNADQLRVVDIARAISARAAAIRAGEDAVFLQNQRDTNRLPPWLLGLGMRIAEFFQYGLNRRTGWMGVPPDPVGSAEVSSVGMFGVRTAYGPFFPLARNAIAVVAGAVEDDVVAVDGKPVVMPTLVLNATFDHRVIDGFHAAVLTHEVRQLLEHPALLDVDANDVQIPDGRAYISK